MAKNIEPKLKKIGEYLKLEKDTIFVIPQYQRAYSWGIDQCDKLWQDIIDFVETGNNDGYFFGTIIISCKETDAEYELIDGQQRINSLYIGYCGSYAIKLPRLHWKKAYDESIQPKTYLYLNLIV